MKKRTKGLINSSLLVLYTIFVTLAMVEHGFSLLEPFIYITLAVGIQMVYVSLGGLKGVKKDLEDLFK